MRPELDASPAEHVSCTTRAQRVAIGEAIEAELQGRVGNPNLKDSIPENFPELPKGDTRDLAAKAAGFGNARSTPVQRPLKPNPNRPGYRWVSKVAKAPRWSHPATV